jgi:hypothetical protein
MLRTEYENLDKLAKCGLRTPELVAYGDHRFAGGVINSFIITKEIPQAMGLITLPMSGWDSKLMRIASERLTN